MPLGITGDSFGTPRSEHDTNIPRGLRETLTQILMTPRDRSLSDGCGWKVQSGALLANCCALFVINFLQEFLSKKKTLSPFNSVSCNSSELTHFNEHSNPREMSHWNVSIYEDYQRIVLNVSFFFLVTEFIYDGLFYFCRKWQPLKKGLIECALYESHTRREINFWF